MTREAIAADKDSELQYAEQATERDTCKHPFDLVSKWSLFTSVVAVVVVSLKVMLLSLPAADDWFRASQPPRVGWWTCLKTVYLTWQGRWLAVAIEITALSKVDVTHFYPLLIGTVALVSLIAAYAVIRLFTSAGSRFYTVGVTICLAALFWSAMPSLRETVNWFTGGVENISSVALSAALLAGLVSRTPSRIWTSLAFILALIIPGLHEAFGAALCAALAGGTATAFWMRSKNRETWTFTLAAAIFGLAIVLIAPGNLVRMHQDGPSHPLSLASGVLLATRQAWNNIEAWIMEPQVIAASLWIAFSPRLDRACPARIRRLDRSLKVAVMMIWIATVVCGFLIPSFALGHPMPDRTLSGVFVIFLSGWLVAVFLFTRWQGEPGNEAMHLVGWQSQKGTSAALLIFSFAILTTGNNTIAFRELEGGRIKAWHASVEARYRLLRSAGTNDVLLPPIEPESFLEINVEISPDPTYLYNWIEANYFNVKTIRLRPAEAK